MNIKTIVKGINLAMTVGGTAITLGQVMYKTFKWYENKHGKKEKKNDIITKPIIKGGVKNGKAKD
jgi:hypothetical protein